MAGRVPERGEIIRHDSGLEFEVIDADSRRVKRLRISDSIRKTKDQKPATLSETTSQAEHSADKSATTS